METLQHPERFPSLPSRRAIDRHLLLWRLPSFAPDSSWSLYRQGSGGAFVVRRLEHDESKGLPVNVDSPHIYGAEARLDQAAAEAVLEEFGNLRLQLSRPGFLGIDGTTYGFELGGAQQFTRVQWWSGGGSGDDALQRCFDSAMQLFEAVLPASTLRCAGR